MDKKYVKGKDSNSATRVPVCFCIDVSGTMMTIIDDDKSKLIRTGTFMNIDGVRAELVDGGTTWIAKVKEGLELFYQAIEENDAACDSCECAVVTFNSEVRKEEDFGYVYEKKVKDLEYLCKDEKYANETRMVPAIEASLKLLEEKIADYDRMNIPYNKPWFVLFTDGKPTDNAKDIDNIAQKCIKKERDKKLIIYTVALKDDAELKKFLSKFSEKSSNPIMLKSAKQIQSVFTFLAKSVSASSNGNLDIEYDNYQYTGPEF